jgi:hypothetical protein
MNKPHEAFRERWVPVHYPATATAVRILLTIKAPRCVVSPPATWYRVFTYSTFHRSRTSQPLLHPLFLNFQRECEAIMAGHAPKAH